MAITVATATVIAIWQQMFALNSGQNADKMIQEIARGADPEQSAADKSKGGKGGAGGKSNQNESGSR